jgi:hypothetical protein
MSFSDLMSSGRGPGLIGTVLALFLLLGFGLLFMFSADDGAKGDVRSLAGFVRDQTVELNSLKNDIDGAETRLKEAPQLVAANKQFSALRLNIHGQSEQLEQLKKTCLSLKTALTEGQKACEDYKNQYRVFVRGRAKGQMLAELKTKKGEVFKNVNIREVTAVGIQIRHEEGQKRIPFEELPPEMIDYYQFDPEQKQLAITGENSAFANHEAANDAAMALEDQKAKQKKASEALEQMEKNKLRIAVKSVTIQKLNADIARLSNDLDRNANDANSARSAGRIRVDSSGNIAGELASKRNQLNALEREIEQLMLPITP